MKNIGKLAACVALAGLFSGCASTKQYVHFPDQTKMIEDPAKARVYVARPSNIGGAISMDVTDGTTLIGSTGPKGYLCWERDPGTMKVLGMAENTAKLSLDVESNTIYYIKQSPKMGFWIARNRLEQVTGDAGRKMVGQCKPPKLE